MQTFDVTSIIVIRCKITDMGSNSCFVIFQICGNIAVATTTNT